MYDRFFLNMTFICLNYTFWQNESPDLSIRQQTSKKAVVESLQRGQLWSSFLIIACRREKQTSTITVTQSGELCPWDVAAPFSHTTLYRFSNNSFLSTCAVAGQRASTLCSRKHPALASLGVSYSQHSR